LTISLEISLSSIIKLHEVILFDQLEKVLQLLDGRGRSLLIETDLLSFRVVKLRGGRIKKLRQSVTWESCAYDVLQALPVWTTYLLGSQ
jgi:hypothetical protein